MDTLVKVGVDGVCTIKGQALKNRLIETKCLDTYKIEDLQRRVGEILATSDKGVLGVSVMNITRLNNGNVTSGLGSGELG